MCRVTPTTSTASPWRSTSCWAASSPSGGMTILRTVWRWAPPVLSYLKTSHENPNSHRFLVGPSDSSGPGVVGEFYFALIRMGKFVKKSLQIRIRNTHPDPRVKIYINYETRCYQASLTVPFLSFFYEHSFVELNRFKKIPKSKVFLQNASILNLEIRIWILLIMLDPEQHKINASAILFKRKKKLQWKQCCGSGMFIPGQNISIQDFQSASKNLSIFDP